MNLAPETHFANIISINFEFCGMTLACLDKLLSLGRKRQVFIMARILKNKNYRFAFLYSVLSHLQEIRSRRNYWQWKDTMIAASKWFRHFKLHQFTATI